MERIDSPQLEEVWVFRKERPGSAKNNMAELNAENSKAFLQLKGSDPGAGSVYEHFTKMVAKVIDDRPEDPRSAFEILSRFVRVTPPDAADGLVPAERLQQRAEYTEKQAKLTKPAAEDGGEGGGGAIETAVPNFMEEAEMFEWAGVGFGLMESSQIMMSLQKLAMAEDPKPKKLRLWGKILGNERDYLVAEGQMDGAAADGGEDPNDPDKEPQGVGANKYTYWVTSEPCGAWVKLGEVSPAHVIASRQIKRMFSGNLDARVVSHPHFPGDEKALLRAQIARITADTVLCINGFLATSEEDENLIEENPEFVFPSAEALAKKGGWTHCVEHILKIGRTSYKEPSAEGEDAEAELAELNKKKAVDPPRPMLRGLVDDKDLDWSVQQFGDMATYKTEDGGIRSNRVTAVRSLTWPGAVCVAKGGGGFANMYVGYGMKVGDPDFFPMSPPEIMDEPATADVDQPEPQGEQPKQEAAAEEEGG